MDWGVDPGRTRRVWIAALALIALVGMALTTALAINNAPGSDPTILAPIVGTSVGALAAIAALSRHDDDGPAGPPTR